MNDQRSWAPVSDPVVPARSTIIERTIVLDLVGERADLDEFADHLLSAVTEHQDAFRVSWMGMRMWPTNEVHLDPCTGDLQRGQEP